MENKLTVPISIIIAGLLIGGAVIYTNKPVGTQNPVDQSVNTPKTANIKPITSNDHILGNPNAKVLMVEYSDTECPYCKLFNTTLNKIIDTYGKDSTVAWVYRQYPIVQLHPKSPKEAEATECVNKLAGNDVFWKYLQKIYTVTPSNNNLDAAQLPILAASFGVDKTAFQTCLDSGTFTANVNASVDDAAGAGAQGTPFTVLIPKNKLSDNQTKQIKDLFTTMAMQYQVTPDKLGYVTTDGKIVISGNLPYEFIQQIIGAIVS